jgi:FAD/FMN-containing dehydrogenase
LGRHQGEDPRGSQALHREGDFTPPADHARDSGSVNPRYLEDASGHRGCAERVIVPAGEAELAAAIREAARQGIPITVAGAGTGVTGGCVPSGGWVISLEKLNRLEVHTGYAIAGAGALLRDVHAAAARANQFYPPDPTETSASIGGNIATNASGSRSFRYGATRRWIESLRVVLADGSVREFARGEPIDFDVPAIPLPDVTKNTAGYLLRPGMDWVDLFCGSEGTLGIVAEARLRLLPAPRLILSGVVFFRSDAEALDAVDEWRAIPSLRMLEYMDVHSLRLLRNRISEIPADAAACLMVEQELESEDDPEIDRIAADDSAWFGFTARDRERFRQFRHTLPELVNDTVRRLGAVKMNTDYAVPLARNRDMLAFYRQRLEEEVPGRYVLFGHIGDAHVHVNIFGEATALLTEFARHAVSLGGTVSAEHGLGKRKRHLLPLQYAPEHIEAMRAVKRRLDPQDILGRGTLFE